MKKTVLCVVCGNEVKGNVSRDPDIDVTCETCVQRRLAVYEREHSSEKAMEALKTRDIPTWASILGVKARAIRAWINRDKIPSKFWAQILQ